MKALVVEDDLPSRIFMTKILEDIFDCDSAQDGLEAMEKFGLALDEDPYDLVCLDIMMPGKDGQQVLKDIRALEQDRGIGGLDGVKVIMTTALRDSTNIMTAFKSQCEAYLPKPIDKADVLKELRSFGLLE